MRCGCETSLSFDVETNSQAHLTHTVKTAKPTPSADLHREHRYKAGDDSSLIIRFDDCMLSGAFLPMAPVL